MENAVIRGVPGQETRVGDDALIGPHVHLTGCVIEGGSRIATGAVVFNGARIEAGAEVEFHAVVYVNTVVPSGVAVPMGWFAGGQPAELVAPGDWDRIRAIMGPLDYPGTVFGVAASDTSTPMSDVARRYAPWPCTTGITLSPMSATRRPTRTRRRNRAPPGHAAALAEIPVTLPRANAEAPDRTMCHA
jgi:carbonic anhydrase/acetyltransferase-like protein (isoleucine patch superfamily)